MESGTYIQMLDDHRAYIHDDGTIVLNRPCDNSTPGYENKDRMDFIKFELASDKSRIPHDIWLKYWIVGRWESISPVLPEESLDYLCSVVANRFNCKIPDEVKEAITAMRLARRMQQ